MTQTDSYGDFDATDEARETALPAGFVIDGKYEIKRLLGSGGSGSVYEAEHVTIGHRVAIKVVRSSERRREDSLARFQREAKICGAIRHPHVGQIYDVGALEDGTPFMVMELHDGRSFGDVLHESVLPIAAVIEVTRQILAGLGAVHQAGAIHRDVKPDNAMIVRASSGDLVVKLVDFGISKVVRADIRERALTREDVIIGSPDYMAPEQLRGKEVDVRTDLYAVGVLLYEAVTGCVPFNADNITDLMLAIVTQPVTPPSAFRTDCPPELEHLIVKAMSRDPADRFQSADEMSRQLAHVQRAVRYAADPGLTRLQEPMPPRNPTTRRARGLDPGSTANIVVAQAPAVSADAAPAPAKVVRSSLRLRIVIAGAATVAIGLLLTRVLAIDRDLDASSAIPSVTAAPTASERSAGSRHLDPAVLRTARPATAPDLPANLVAAPAAPHASATSDAVGTAASAGPSERPRHSTVQGTRSRTRDQRARGVGTAAVASDENDGPTTRALLDEAASAFVLGQMPRARSIYQQVLERQPTQADAWRGLGLTASRMGQRKDAERAFERYLKLRPNAPDAVRIREQLDKVR